jgi:hypothetical protein
MDKIEKSMFATAMAGVIKERGWCRYTYKDWSGRVCLAGAAIEIAKLEGDRDWFDGTRAAAEVFRTTAAGVTHLNDFCILNDQDAIDTCLKQAEYWVRSAEG